MASADDLPIEIWRTILQLVPRGAGTNLHAVNRTFFQIVMARRYKRVHWDYIWFGNGKRDLYALKSPLISPYIKELDICVRTSQFSKAPSSRLEPLRLTLSSMVKHTSLPELREDSEARNFLQTFAAPGVDMSSRLPSLQKLSIMETPLQHATQSVAGTVRVITLNIPLEFYRDGVFSCDIAFPLLEQLNLGLYAVYLTTDYEDVFEMLIVPWVNRHSKSLTTLSFSVSDPCRDHPRYIYEFKRLFRGLAHIQGLASFRFHWFIQLSMAAGLDELSRFIQAHSGSLSSLYLNIYHSTPLENNHWHNDPEHIALSVTFDKISHFYTPSTFFSHSLFTRTLPSCRMLKTFHSRLLGKHSFQNDPNPFLQWFPTLKCAETLTALHLADNWFNQADLVKLVSEVDLSSLRKLWIGSRPLSMALFDTFAGRLGNLQLLRLRISGVSTRANPSEIIIPQQVLPRGSPFLVDLQATHYPGWTSLSELHMTLEDVEAWHARRNVIPCFGTWEEECWLEESQIRETFPGVRTFSARINGT